MIVESKCTKKTLSKQDNEREGRGGAQKYKAAKCVTCESRRQTERGSWSEGRVRAPGSARGRRCVRQAVCEAASV